MPPILLDAIRRALADATPVSLEELLLLRGMDGQLARQLQPGPDVVPREAAALLLLYPHAGDLWLPLTLRSARLRDHSGQVSLPGGRIDAGDAGAAGAALREAQEELGIDSSSVEILGALMPFYIPPSNYRLTPVVGYTSAPPQIVPNPHEVDAAFSVPLSLLLDPATVQIEEWERGGLRMRVPFYLLEGHKVWGATAILLSEFIARLRRASGR